MLEAETGGFMGSGGCLPGGVVVGEDLDVRQHRVVAAQDEDVALSVAGPVVGGGEGIQDGLHGVGVTHLTGDSEALIHGLRGGIHERVYVGEEAGLGVHHVEVSRRVRGPEGPREDGAARGLPVRVDAPSQAGADVPEGLPGDVGGALGGVELEEEVREDLPDPAGVGDEGVVGGVLVAGREGLASESDVVLAGADVVEQLGEAQAHIRLEDGPAGVVVEVLGAWGGAEELVEALLEVDKAVGLVLIFFGGGGPGGDQLRGEGHHQHDVHGPVGVQTGVLDETVGRVEACGRSSLPCSC